MEEATAYDIIQYGRNNLKNSAMYKGSANQLLIATAASWFEPYLRAPDDGLRCAVDTLLGMATWHTWRFGPWRFGKTYLKRQDVPGASLALRNSILATAAHYRVGLHEWDTGLATLLRADFSHGINLAFSVYAQEGLRELQALRIPAFDFWPIPPE